MSEKYFSDLNYTLANEDTQIEYDLCPENLDSIFSISGSGARCLPLIARNPKQMLIVDMSPAQLFLCELRFQAAKVLTYEEWLFFLGYRGALSSGSPLGDSRLELFKKIELSKDAREYWTKSQAAWLPRGFILLGRWENHFQKLGQFFRNFLGSNFTPIFNAQSLAEQIEIYMQVWPKFRWKSFLRIAASEYVFNKYLYKGHFSGQSKRRTDARPPYKFIEEEFHRVFTTQLVRRNYFMQILFLGEIRYQEGLPFEAHREIFERVKGSQTKVTYKSGDLVQLLPSEAFDFISLSDTISYLPTDAAKNLLQTLHQKTKPDSRMVIRSFLRAPAEMNSQGWEILADEQKKAHQSDGTSVYQFHIFQKK
jgi:S-adenosylmethionine-diacylglycerol 3-amino-3-carboxypropyl transferase